MITGRKRTYRHYDKQNYEFADFISAFVSRKIKEYFPKPTVISANADLAIFDIVSLKRAFWGLLAIAERRTRFFRRRRLQNINCNFATAV